MSRQVYRNVKSREARQASHIGSTIDVKILTRPRGDPCSSEAAGNPPLEAQGVSRHSSPQQMDCPNAARTEDRQLRACVFCAMLRWTEELRMCFIAGPQCDIPNPKALASLLSAEWYMEQWPLIPRENLLASAVDFPHLDSDGYVAAHGTFLW